MTRNLFIGLSVLIAFFTSCTKDKIMEPPIDVPEINKYLHLSHTRTDLNPYMDHVVEKVDYSNFDMLWLGGDLAHLTSKDDVTMIHVDSIFDLGNMNTLWALGNHDYSNLDKLRNYTHRPSFYSYSNNGISFIVLDTQDDDSKITGEQKYLFDKIVDTLNESSHLIILHHKLIWMYGDSNLESQISTVSNGDFGDCFYCINPNNFYTDIYPKLVEVKEKGIEVICIAGDIGSFVNEFEYVTPEGISFLASGLSYGAVDNKALVFDHDIINKKLHWEYELVSDLRSK